MVACGAALPGATGFLAAVFLTGLAGMGFLLGLA